MKNIFTTMIMFGVLFANDLPIKKQDVSPAQLKKQNVEIVALSAKELSKNLPQKIDKYTRLLSVDANHSTLIYSFEINSTKSDEVIKKEDKSRMREGVTIGVCKNSKRFLEAEIDIKYNYLSAKSHKVLFSFNIDREKCAK